MLRERGGPRTLWLSSLSVLIAATSLVASCTPGSDQRRDPTTTGPLPPAGITTTTGRAPTPPAAPERGPSSALEVAEAAVADIPGFPVADDPPLLAQDIATAVELWVPDEFTDATYRQIVVAPSGEHVAVVSVIPVMQFRGDPTFTEDLAAFVSDEPPDTPVDGITGTTTASGATIFLWSTGDGFVATSSRSDRDAIEALEALAATDRPNDVWGTRSCLDFDDSDELPYAPFPPDVVVPCSAPHTAEVLFAAKNGTDLADYDDEAITYERNFRCDEAYSSVFGSQLDHAPSLVTYMPDEDEWRRGDRYLACVVSIERNAGRQVIEGPMADLPDLTFAPPVGSCLTEGLPADTVDCAITHAYQYLGEADIEADEWPTDSSAFQAACAPLLDTVRPGPASVEVLGVGLGAYAFEQGDRAVRCMAFAVDGGFLARVVGPFDGAWRLAGEGGISV